MKFLKIILIIVILLSQLNFLWAEESVQKTFRGNPISLCLNKVLELALINNFDVQMALYDRYIKEADIDESKSIYDTVLTLTADYEYDKSKKSSTLAAKSSHTGSLNAEVSKKFVTGTDVTVAFNNTRESSDSAFTSLNPYYESELEMTFTQPLLYNFFGMQDWGDVKITRIDVRNYSSEILDTIEQNMADVEMAYWDLDVAVKFVDIRREMYKWAEEFYNINKKKKELGTSELTDLLAAEANKELRKTELDVEEDNLKVAINKLKLLINHPESEGDILPVDTITIMKGDISLIPGLKTAFENRRDYERAKNDIEAKRIKFNMKRNARWPELDLEGSLRLNGIERIPKSAASAAFSDHNPEYYAKVTFSFPFEDRSARSEYNKAKNEKAKSLLNLKKVEKTIVTEIDDSVRRVNVYKDKAKKAMRIEELQKKKLEEEEKKFRYGRSDSDRIIRFQEDHLNARTQALRSARDYKQSLVDLCLTEDTFLEKRGLTVQ